MICVSGKSMFSFFPTSTWLAKRKAFLLIHVHDDGKHFHHLRNNCSCTEEVQHSSCELYDLEREHISEGYCYNLCTNNKLAYAKFNGVINSMV